MVLHGGYVQGSHLMERMMLNINTMTMDICSWFAIFTKVENVILFFELLFPPFKVILKCQPLLCNR